MKIKIAEATNRQLDYLVAKAVGWSDEGLEDIAAGDTFPAHDFTTNHALTGPLIESEGIWTRTTDEGEDDPSCKWRAELPYQAVEVGPTLLIAACRCYVASKLGDEVEVPDELA